MCCRALQGLFYEEKDWKDFVLPFFPAACTARPEHPRSPAAPGLLGSMPIRKAPPARIGLEGLIFRSHFPLTAAISDSVKRFTES